MMLSEKFVDLEENEKQELKSKTSVINLNFKSMGAKLLIRDELHSKAKVIGKTVSEREAFFI